MQILFKKGLKWQSNYFTPRCSQEKQKVDWNILQQKDIAESKWNLSKINRDNASKVLVDEEIYEIQLDGESWSTESCKMDWLTQPHLNQSWVIPKEI